MSSIKKHYTPRFLTKLGARLGITFLLFVFLTRSVAACSPAPIAVAVTCPNGHIQRISIEQAENFLGQLSSTCDIGSNRNLLAQEVQRWKEKWKGYFLAGGLTIIPYDAHQEQTIQRANTNLLSCYYSEAKHIGMWLLIQGTSRPYCHLEPFTPCCLCPNIRISIFEFAVYLVSDTQFTSLPYLGLLASIIVGITIFTQRLAKRKELLQFIRPRISTVILAIICAVLFIWRFTAAPIDLIGWIIVAYVLACAIMHVSRRYTTDKESSN